MSGLNENEHAPEEQAFIDELKPGTELMHGQFRIERFLNAGGFGITYEAKDSLNRRVVIKECFPGAFCRRSTALVTARSRAHQQDLASIVKLFVREARSLAKLKHPNIVGVHQVFEENNTAYMALDFVEGRDLLQIIEDKNTTLTPGVIEDMLSKLLEAIAFIHGQNILHRDISPDNILLDVNNQPVLIDFGAAREEATKQSRVLTAMRVVKDGYSPQEFYIAGSDQGPHSDLYALGASMYHLISGEVPPVSQVRLAAVAGGEPDPYEPLKGRVDGYNPNFLAALDKSLAILPRDRIASAEEWQAIILGVPPKSADVVVLANAAAPKFKPQEKADEEPTKGKSRIGLLLASAAVVAIAAVGALSLTDLFGGSTAISPVEIEVVEAPVSDIDDQGDTSVVAGTIASPVNDQATELTSASETQDSVDEDLSGQQVAETSETTPALRVETQIEEQPKPAKTEEQGETVLTSADESVPSDTQSISPEAAASAAAAVRPIARPFSPPVSSYADTSQAWRAPVSATRQQPLAAANPSDLNTQETEAAAPAQDAIQAETKVQIAGLQSKRRVELPYESLLTAGEGETRIFAVNGKPVSNRADFDAVIDETLADYSGTKLDVMLSIGVSQADARDQKLTLPISQRVSLSNGLVFDVSQQDDAWTTRVAVVPEGMEIDMRRGDVLYGYLLTNELLSGPETLETILTREFLQGATSFSFAVKRDDDTWVVAVPFEGAEPTITTAAKATQ